MSNYFNANQQKTTHQAPAQLSILIVPDGGTPHRYQVKVLWVRLAVAGLVFLVVMIIVAAISYGSLFSKALERDRLLAENARLLKENYRIVELSKEVDDSRRSLERIVKSLGGKLELSNPNSGDTL